MGCVAFRFWRGATREHPPQWGCDATLMRRKIFGNVKQVPAIVAATLSVFGTVQAQRCAVCDLPITDRAYLIQDKVTEEQKRVCDSCIDLNTRCFLCGLPVKNNITELEDGRVLCARDAKD